MTGTLPSGRAGAAVALRFSEGTLWALDQTLLPFEAVEVSLHSAAEVAEAIRGLAIRGAPLIGVGAGYGVALELLRDPSPAALERACQILRDARPTAVNLARAVDRVRAAVLPFDPLAAAELALTEAQTIDREERQASAAIAGHGARLLASAKTVLTHCNTGALAAPGAGTALGVVAELAERHGLKEVVVTESRPLLQGARLTTWELSRLGIAHELIVDSAAPGLISGGVVDAVIVGCDRVAANGDVANKVGTYSLALAALAAGVDFVVAGPTSTVDLDCPTGAQIQIEERDPEEVRRAGSVLLTQAGTPCRNPAFDVTPAALVTALVTERGVVQPVDASGLAALVAR